MPQAAEPYTTETHTVIAGESTFTVESRTPELSELEYQERLGEIEHALYDIFSPYENSRPGAAGV